ncbi:hypothetical protein CN367_11860 [Priestia megaterium]|uniref:exonuclease domain-containing protein n=1 Tax=Priestia megaterium TaxID=1404 RepID=UPI000BF5F96B|nr:exonuclease domain-containing protein [Priestia megaterium]PEZ47055.1 hypothetical protein CN367_11860 [Priestia megaterium]
MKTFDLIAVLDFETTGLNPQLDHPTEVAVNVYGKGGLVAKYSSMIMLPEGVEVSEFITNLTGLTTEKVNSEGAEKVEVQENLIDLLVHDKFKTLVVGHNINFDLGFLKHHFDIEPENFMCTRTIEILTTPHFNASLQEAHKRHFLEGMEQTHRAGDDIQMTWELFCKQAEIHGEHGFSFFLNKVVDMPDRELVYTPHNAIVLDFSQKYYSSRYVEQLREKIESMEEDVEKLSCLEGAGVDNWEGYSYAMEMMEEEN